MKKTALIIFAFAAALTFSCKKDLEEKATINTSPVTDVPLSAPPNDPFGPYLTSVPTVLTTISTTNTTSGGTPITVKRFTFSSKGGVNTVFGIMAYPQAAGTYPAILFNHGGGGNAETMLGNVQTYAG